MKFKIEVRDIHAGRPEGMLTFNSFKISVKCVMYEYYTEQSYFSYMKNKGKTKENVNPVLNFSTILHYYSNENKDFSSGDYNEYILDGYEHLANVIEDWNTNGLEEIKEKIIAQGIEQIKEKYKMLDKQVLEARMLDASSKLKQSLSNMNIEFEFDVPKDRIKE